VPLLLCDLDDTLIDRQTAFDRWIAAFCAAKGIPADAIPWLTEQDQRGFRSRSDFFDIVLRRHPLPASRDMLTEEFQQTFADFFPPVAPDTAAALSSVREMGWRVGVISNGSPAQRLKITTTGLLELIDGYCVSAEVGVRKPDPAIFRLAAERLGASLAEAWMIGDSPEADIAGAHRIGIASAWIRLGRSWEQSDFEPSLSVESVAEAVRLILGGPEVR